jgi:hypothetical protein
MSQPKVIGALFEDEDRRPIPHRPAAKMPAAMTPAALETPGWSALATLAAFAAILVVFAAAQARWILTDQVAPWDSKLQFYPFFRFIAESFEAGVAPFWNPYHYAGHPSVSDPQSLVFNPVFALIAWLAPEASMRWFDLAVALHLLGGGVAVALIGKRWGFGAAGAALAAIIFMLGGSASGRLQHTGQIVSYGWFAVSLWLLDGSLARRSLVRAALFGLAAGLMAVGRDQVAYIGAILLVLYAAGFVVAHRPFPGFLISRIPALLVMGLVGAVVIAAPMLLTVQLAQISNRPEIPFWMAAGGSLYWVNFATLLAPNVFGSLSVPYDYWGPGSPTRPWVDATDRTINYLFAGTIPMAVVLLIGVARGRLFSAWTIAPVAILLIAGLYALGAHTPAFRWMFDTIPGVNLYRRPADATFLFNVGVALLAGGLLGAYVREEWRRPGVVGLVVAALAAGGLLAGALYFATILDRVGSSGVEAGLAAAALAIAAGSMIVVRTPGGRAALAACFVVLTGAELVWRNAASALNAEPAAVYSALAAPTAEEEAALAFLDAELARRHAAGDHPRVEMLGLGGPWQNVSMVRGVENTLGYNPLRLADYERLMEPGQNSHIFETRAYPVTFAGYEGAFARRLGLEYLALGKPMAETNPHFPRPANAELLLAGPPMHLYRLPPALPRAVLSTRVARAEQQVINDLGEYLAGDDPDLVMVERADPLEGAYRAPDAPAISAGAARILRLDPGFVEIAVDSATPAILVLHDPFFPGWTADVDGAPRPVLRVNQMFRGIEVPAGASTVRFRFAPLSPGNLVRVFRALLDPQTPLPGFASPAEAAAR